MSERFAIYFAPPNDGALWRRASDWLDRDSANSDFQRQATPPLDAAQLALNSKSARHYGFHATLKAPMALAEGQSFEALDTALKALASEHAGVDIGHCHVASLQGFLAIIPVAQPQALTDFAFDVVQAFDRFRAPLSDRDRARRHASGLSARQSELLDAWGYPYVAEQFQFHMTLTDRLSTDDLPTTQSAAESWFAPALADPIRLDRLALFHQPVAGADFVRLGDYHLVGSNSF